MPLIIAASSAPAQLVTHRPSPVLGSLADEDDKKKKMNFRKMLDAVGDEMR
jgi:hypothetical protein